MDRMTELSCVSRSAATARPEDVPRFQFGQGPEMTMMSAGEVTRWCDELRRGDGDGATPLWNRYHEPLLRRAWQSLNPGQPHMDAEDAAASAFHDFCHGMIAGRFPELGNRGELWALLTVILDRKLREHARWRFRLRRGRLWRREDVPLDQIAEKVPSWTLGLGQQLIEEMMAELPDDGLTRPIAIWRLEGWSLREIARKSGRSTATVKRKLGLIRDCWARHLT